jgi:hypothetical protein
MSRLVWNGRQRVAVTLGALLVLGALLAGPAWGATTDCAHLQNAISTATTGETIDLTETCTNATNGGSFTLPTMANVTIEGAAAGDGFDGTGASGPALHGTAPAGLTLRNLAFKNYALTGASAVTLQLSTGALPVIDHDSFLNNTSTSSATPAGGGLDIFNSDSSCPYTGSLTITDSLFSGNVLTTHVSTSSPGSGVTGGGASVSLECDATHTASLLITGNTFTQNSIHTDGDRALGAGLYVADDDPGQLTATQSGNVFQSNSIFNDGTTATTFDGGGEWLASVNLTSSSDAYIGNSLPSPGTGSASEGAGLGTVRGDCGTTGTVTATTMNLVAAGNTIGTPSGTGEVEGAGVYAGCVATAGTGGFALTLISSTVSGNSGPGGAAGVDGESTDSLTLENSIVAGNTGATEIDGFGTTPGANVTATNSDVCAIGSTTAPFAGTGNICADPSLAAAATGDVHETAGSPTIDAGSNALVPSGVSTDFYGQPRIVGTKQAAGIVDIGAAEFQTAFVPPTGPTPPPTGGPTLPKPPVAHVVKERVTASGVDVTIRCAGTASQRCAGAVTLTTVEVRVGSKLVGVAGSAGHKRKHRYVTTRLARITYRLPGGHSITVHLKHNRVGQSLRRRFHKLPVKATVTQTGTRKPISTRKLTLRAPKPKPKPH